MNLIPGLSLRVSAEDEEIGCDDCQLGEFAYDYVELTRQVADGGSSNSSIIAAESGISTYDEKNMASESAVKAPTEMV